MKGKASLNQTGFGGEKLLLFGSPIVAVADEKKKRKAACLFKGTGGWCQGRE